MAPSASESTEAVVDYDFTPQAETPPNQPHLGDLMGWQTTWVSMPEDFTPLERVIMTANGNLQRVMSSYYNAKVDVRIVYNRPKGPGLYDRQVELLVFGKVFCVATSTVHLTNDKMVELVEEKKIGLGQLFRHLNLLPFFFLRKAGKSATTIWREYTLQAEGVVCEIREDFPANVFELTPSP